MMTIIEMYGSEKVVGSGYKITPGKKYQVTVFHQQISPDAYLQEKFIFTDDSGAKDEISYLWIDNCMCSKEKWRETQINKLGI